MDLVNTGMAGFMPVSSYAQGCLEDIIGRA
jgi:hypothetical protein